MLSPVSTDEELTPQYTTVIDKLCEVAGAYLALGRSADAQHILEAAMQLTDMREVREQDRLKLLLQYAKFLIIDYLRAHANADLMFSTIQNAKHLAETIYDQSSLADALSLLGQAHYFAVLHLSSVIDSPEGKFDEALTYQQQALELREALHDTRGISESYFFIGNVYERWQQYDVAQEYYEKALQIADQHSHIYEKTEPSRHLAILALRNEDLDQALSYALQALNFREKARFKRFLPLDHALLSDIYLKKKDTANALFHAQRGSALAEETGSQVTFALSLLSLGDVAMARKENVQAQAHYEKALVLTQELQIAPMIALAKERLQRLIQQ